MYKIICVKILTRETFLYYNWNITEGRESVWQTIQDIAKAAGVSTATVSHVVNHTRYVSPELVARVEEAIQKCGGAAQICKEKKGKGKKADARRRRNIYVLISDITNPMYMP